LRSADFLAERALIVRMLVLELRGREHVLGIDDEQQVVMRLQVDVPCVRWRRHISDGRGPARVEHIHDTEALREHMTNIGVTAMHHQLHTVGTAALVAVANQPHIAGKIGNR